MSLLPVQGPRNHPIIPARVYSKSYSLNSSVVDTTKKDPPIKDIVQQILAEVTLPLEATKDSLSQIGNNYFRSNPRCKVLCRYVLSVVRREYPEKSFYPQLVESITLRQIFEDDLNTLVRKTASYLEKLENSEIIRFWPLLPDSFFFNQVLEKVLKIAIDIPWLEEQPEAQKYRMIKTAIAIYLFL